MGVLSDNKTQPGGEGFNQNQNYGSGMPDLAALERKIHQKLMEEVDPEQLSKLDRASMANEIQIVMYAVLAQEGIALPARARERMVANIIDEIIGYGPIQPLLEDQNISEVMVNSAKKVYAERSGKIFLTDKVFRDDAHILRIIEKIVSPLGRRIDEASPMVDARLPDGSRVNAIIPPIAISGPTLTIRKFSKDPYTVNDLIEFGSLTKEMADFLKACVLARLNIIVSGGTGSGKTTTLNVLSSFIPNDERIVTIEDAAELQLQQDHIVTLEARPSNLEGRGEISIRMLVKNSLRMRPDRIVIGECRGGEALDMLQAMNTGHDG
ncbi:MAG TPA: type II secretion system protein E, partial [Armatimonadetes bacterium]|nr:type II secretion system protein E [Armatimonadota bacterium]